MAVAAASIISALAAVAGTASSIAAQSGRGNPAGDARIGIAQQELQGARDNETFQRMVSALINQRSVAGQEDSFGSSLEYDPATNTWRSKLGALPLAAQTAAEQAGIARNTTDVRQAQFANEQALKRAAIASPAADTALRNLQSFRPMQGEELTGLLQQQASNAANQTFQPLIAQTLQDYARTGTPAGDALAKIGRAQAGNLRDSLIDAQIKGMTGVDSINQGRRQGLEQSAANLSTLTNPQFQYPGISQRTDDMAKIVAARAQQGAAIPAYGMGGVNNAAGQSQTASNALSGAQYSPMNNLETIGNTIQSKLGNKDFTNNLSTALGSLFGPSETKGDLTGYSYADYARNLESDFAAKQNQNFGQ